MGLFRLLFRVARKSKHQRPRRTSVINASRHTVERPNPVPESEKVRSTNDVERIRSLPTVNVEYIIDGDTVIVASNYSKLRVRLDSIDCPEDGEDGQEWGEIATRGLIKLIGGKSVRLEVHGADAHNRTLGTLFVYLQEKGEWQNVNERMVTLGHAWVMRKYYYHLPKARQQKLNQLERWAKSKRVGLWKTENPIPPWNWRKS